MLKKISPISKRYADAHEVSQLAGGVVSVVCLIQPTSTSNPPGFVVKNTLEYDPETAALDPFFQRDHDRLLKPAPATHLIDLDLLLHLQTKPFVQVPTIIEFDRDEKLTMMDDFRQAGFEMLQETLVKGNLTVAMGSAIGQSLADLVYEMCQLSRQAILTPAESTVTQIEERTEELRVTLGYDSEYRGRVQNILLRMSGDGKTLVATDTHPKNIAVRKITAGDSNGYEVMYYDFGRTIFADPQFSAPNFAAHIGLALLGGCVSVNIGVRFLSDFTDAYSRRARELGIDMINEPLFVEYFLCELLHRGKGARWIDSRLFTPFSDTFTEAQVKDSVSIAVEVLSKKLLRTERADLSIRLLLDSLGFFRKKIEAKRFTY